MAKKISLLRLSALCGCCSCLLSLIVELNYQHLIVHVLLLADVLLLLLLQDAVLFCYDLPRSVF